ncbi:YitT family protein [Paenibacillus sp. Marseille-Q7038]
MRTIKQQPKKETERYGNKVPALPAFLKSTGMMMLGTMLMAFAFYHINYVNHLSEGGFVGLALLGSYVAGWPAALTSLLLDLPIILIAWYLMGRKYMYKALLGAISFSLFYEWCERYSPLVIDLHGSLLAAAIFSGILTGIGAGLVIRSGSATGGDDILAVIISQRSRFKIGTVFFLMDAVVLVVSLAFMPLKETLYTILAVWISGKLITLITQGSIQSQPKTEAVPTVPYKQAIRNKVKISSTVQVVQSAPKPAKAILTNSQRSLTGVKVHPSSTGGS